MESGGSGDESWVGACWCIEALITNWCRWTKRQQWQDHIGWWQHSGLKKTKKLRAMLEIERNNFWKKN